MKLPKSAIREIEQGLEANQVCEVCLVGGSTIKVLRSPRSDIDLTHPILLKSSDEQPLIICITKRTADDLTPLVEIAITAEQYWMLGIKGMTGEVT